nr:NAD(P)H-dependent glycerol-3-phosphate dehydrogenase [uncultured Rhodopila sp.]
MSKVSVIGAGAWGTALAIQAARAGNDVTLVARSAVAATAISNSRTNLRLPGVPIPVSIHVGETLPPRSDLLVWVVPTQQLRSSLIRYRPSQTPIVVCAKGVEIGSHLLPLEVVTEASPAGPLGILSGPNFAHEVAAGLPAASVVASSDPGLRDLVRACLGTNSFRLYGNDDPMGAQLGGAAKNVIAIAAGAVIGAGLGENARAALVTRGLSELCRLAAALGGRAETVMGLSGLGDLLLTCTGTSSRNFSLGYALGQGKSLAGILAERTGVTEGVSTASALVERAGNVELPICRAVSELLMGMKTLNQSIVQLLSRPQRDE